MIIRNWIPNYHKFIIVIICFVLNKRTYTVSIIQYLPLLKGYNSTPTFSYLPIISFQNYLLRSKNNLVGARFHSLHHPEGFPLTTDLNHESVGLPNLFYSER